VILNLFFALELVFIFGIKLVLFFPAGTFQTGCKDRKVIVKWKKTDGGGKNWLPLRNSKFKIQNPGFDRNCKNQEKWRFFNDNGAK
jgi:hypothetical protein